MWLVREKDRPESSLIAQEGGVGAEPPDSSAKPNYKIPRLNRDAGAGHTANGAPAPALNNLAEAADAIAKTILEPISFKDAVTRDSADKEVRPAGGAARPESPIPEQEAQVQAGAPAPGEKQNFYIPQLQPGSSADGDATKSPVLMEDLISRAEMTDNLARTMLDHGALSNAISKRGRRSLPKKRRPVRPSQSSRFKQSKTFGWLPLAPLYACRPKK